jgi:hypothetical protein
MLKIILFAYSKGITSSREIQWCCEHNIIFKALSGDTVPHYTSIATFVRSFPRPMELLFEQILLICHEQGLVGNELFAIDGCKMSSNAAKEWSGTFKELEKKRDKIKRQLRQAIKKHKKLDKQDPDNQDAINRIQQTIETLDSADQKIDEFLKTHEPRMGQAKRRKEVKSNITDNESAKMTTSKGTIQGYNGVATVDSKHQVIIDAQAFGEGQEHHTLRPVLEAVEERFERLGIHEAILDYQDGAIITADTGFANESNMQYLYEKDVDAYIPDNQFRSRDPAYQDQKNTHGKRHQDTKKPDHKDIIPASEFQFDPIGMTCVCPAGNELSFRGERDTIDGTPKAYFEGKLLQCRNCDLKHQCMKNPESADHRKGNGRQVSFILNHKRKPSYTDWMKDRVDSDYGKRIYGHRMATVEPVFANIGTNKV